YAQGFVVAVGVGGCAEVLYVSVGSTGATAVKTARIPIAAWRGNSMAARGARATADAGDRVSQRAIARGYVPSYSGIPARVGGKRLHRRTERRHRIPLRCR